jgi:O-antigen ligase
VFADVLSDRFDEESLGSLGLRLDIWEFARTDLLGGAIPLFGIGFGCTPGLLEGVELRTSEGWAQATHFHSIFIEYAFGLGILAIVPAAWIVRRTVEAVMLRSPGALLFLLFLACQAVDYSFYRPKEVLFWSLVLGIADAQTRNQTRQRRSPR